jgi:osmotically-inducible protein OsmY
MKRKLLAVLIAAVFAAPAAYAQGTTAPKDRPAASGSASTKAGASARSNDGSPDAVITGKIKSGFIKDKIVRSRNYNVDTNGGVVTVRGKARSQAEADRAMEIAKGTEGVKSVNSEIKVVAEADKPKREGTTSSSTRRSSSTASTSAREPSDPLAKGDAKKAGDMSTSAKAGAAGTTASTGTSASTSRDGGSPDGLITTKIKAEYAKDKAVSATNIHVDTNKGVVTLTGAAKSKAEADKAVTLAKSVKGVTSVKNDIKVESK